MSSDNGIDYYIPLPDGVKLHGVLNIVPETLREGILILVHGRLDHANKGPLARIAPQLPFHTFRYSARGMGLSEGETGYSHAEVEAEDLACVVKFVRNQLMHLAPPPLEQILGIAGHSQGAVVCLMYMSNLHTKMNPSISVPLVVSISGRYSSHGTENRLPAKVVESINNTGSAVWLNYRAGPEWIKRPYIITAEALNSHRERVLDCVEKLPASCAVLTIHGKEDGTVWPENSTKIDRAIKKSDATSDLVLVQGVGHFWELDGDTDVLSGFIVTWINARFGRSVRKVKGELVDELARP